MRAAQRTACCICIGSCLIIQILSSISSVYVRRGSDIGDCSMKCPHTRDVLVLYRICGAEETKLLELWCDNSWSYNHWDPRLHLNTSSGCWRLTDARKNDSCLYVLWRHNRSGGFRRSTAITVLDPVLISNITSNSSRLGQDIAVSVQFSGEEAAVTWEVDGGSLPHRYRLIDGNRTLIIPSAQREDAGRRLHAWVTNPVSEETWEYLLEITDPRSLTLQLFLVAAALAVVILLSAGIFLCCKKKNMAAFQDVEMEQMDGHSEENGDPPRADQSGVLIIQILSSISSVYVRRGSDFGDCGMKCPHTGDVLQLDRECGGGETKLLELWCDNSWSYNHSDPRLHLNTSSGCWRLTDARKDDSCLYVLWRHNRSGGFQRSTAITVLDPVLISNITSNSSRLGQDIAVSVQFSGEEAAVTWEVDGGSLPDRYRLIDNNRTLMIPKAQREDARRRLRVRITNPVSEETREYLLEITGPRSLTLRLSLVAAALAVVILLSAGIFLVNPF